MRTNFYLSIGILLLTFIGLSSFNGFAASTGEPTDTVLHFNQRFALGSGEISSAVKLEGFLENIKEIEDRDTTKRIDIVGRASIDGRTSLNDKLAYERAMILRDSIVEICHVNPDKIFVTSIGEDWNMLADLVKADPYVPARDRVLSTIDSNLDNDQKESKLRGYDEGRTWEYLNDHIFPAMRSAQVTWELSKRVLPPKKEEVVVVQPQPVIEEPVVEEVVEVIEVVEKVIPEPVIEDDWYRKMYIKTNVPAWAVLWQNLAVEFDLAKHWSFSVPVYWSPYNYGTQTLKFRTLAVVPEFRYWPKAENMGFFINAHFGMAYYNYAKDGEYRYQDHDAKTPALGGGIGIGYRFYFCKNHHWSMEAAIGGGVYRLDYDIFMNTPHTNQGYLVGREKRTFYGIDQAAFSICYSFGLRKKQ